MKTSALTPYCKNVNSSNDLNCKLFVLILKN